MDWWDRLEIWIGWMDCRAPVFEGQSLGMGWNGAIESRDLVDYKDRSDRCVVLMDE
jgi:hypothetical protein